MDLGKVVGWIPVDGDALGLLALPGQLGPCHLPALPVEQVVGLLLPFGLPGELEPLQIQFVRGDRKPEHEHDEGRPGANVVPGLRGAGRVPCEPDQAADDATCHESERDQPGYLPLVHSRTVAAGRDLTPGLSRVRPRTDLATSYRDDQAVAPWLSRWTRSASISVVTK